MSKISNKFVESSWKPSNELFTSESVCAGHPDKIADRISDELLDEFLLQDPYAKTGIETVVGANRVAVFGEVNSTAKVDVKKVVGRVICELGYTNPAWGFSDASAIDVYLHQQSPEIAQGVIDDSGAGDQGMMFGYAIDETEQLLPTPIVLAHALTRRIDEVRQKGELAYIRPDGKSQITIRYKNDVPVAVEKVVIATAHGESISNEQVFNDVFDIIVTPVLKQYGYTIQKDQLIVNGTGTWHIPGPQSDAGLTGRKIIVDGYGGFARVGGGAFSGKDPSKVDRSGAYAARYIAKNIVANGLAKKCEVSLAYVIGQPHPLAKTINTFGTHTVSQKELNTFADTLIDTSVKGIIETLQLRRPIYSSTSAYGHFGNPVLPWEQVKTYKHNRV
ncbi:methionine adenosyltransferase [bacterium]|nr:methionine adenosyltransferase [bacterium]